jgi:hypothetical protein
MLIGIETKGQIVPSLSNVLRYGNGQQSIGTVKEEFKYFENLTDVRVQFPYNFTAGIRLLYDIPPEVGFEFKGLKRRFVEYDAGFIYARLGDFSQLYGRGLAINLFENRGLGYDTWMDGLNLKYKHNFFNASVVYGTLNFDDSVDIARHEIHRLRGGNFELTPLKALTVGLTYIFSKSTLELIPDNKELEINLPSFYLNYSFADFNLSFDYANKKTKNLTDELTSNGAGYYSSISYNRERLGITLDYKNYFFDESDPFERNDITRYSRMMPFQNPPIVMKEHSYTLLTRSIHEVDFNDEIGLQLDLIYALADNTELNFNASLASRRNYYVYDQANFEFNKQSRSTNFIPSSNKEYSPYWEVFGEVIHYFNPTTFFKLAFALRESTIYDEFFDGINNHIIRSTVIPIQINQTVSSFYSFEAEIEYEKVFDNFNVSQMDYHNILFTLTNVFFSQGTLTLRYELTNNEYDVSEKMDWFTIEAGIRIFEKNTLVVSYGSEKGGQVCSNGVCRYLQPFEGFRFSLLINI